MSGALCCQRLTHPLAPTFSSHWATQGFSGFVSTQLIQKSLAAHHCRVFRQLKLTVQKKASSRSLLSPVMAKSFTARLGKFEVTLSCRLSTVLSPWWSFPWRHRSLLSHAHSDRLALCTPPPHPQTKSPDGQGGQPEQRDRLDRSSLTRD